MVKNKKTPMRMCAGCREMKPKQELVRVIRTPEGTVRVDTTGKASGRGVYVCKNEECLKKSIRSKALSRALEVPVGEEVLEALAGEIGK